MYSPGSPPLLNRLAPGFAVLVAGVGMLSLFGWVAEQVWLAPFQLPPGAFSPIEAILLLSAAGALVSPTVLARLIGVGLLLAGLVMLGYSYVDPVGIPTSLLPVPAMSMLVSIYGLGLILRDWKAPHGAWLAQICAQVMTIIGGFGLLGQLSINFNGDRPRFASVTGMALHSIVGTLLLGLGLLVSRPNDGFMALLGSQRPTGRLLRRLLWVSLMVSLLVGLVTNIVWSNGLRSTGIGLMVALLGNLLIAYLATDAYDRANRGLHIAEVRLTQLQTDLERQVAERIAELDEREAQIRIVSDNLPGAMIYQLTIDPDLRPRFTYLSAGVEQVWGVSLEEALVNPGLLYATVDPEDLTTLREHEARAHGQSSLFDIEVRKRTVDGKRRWSHMRSIPRRLADGRIIWDGIELDITPQKEAQAALERDRRYQAALFASSQALLHPARTQAERDAALYLVLEQLRLGSDADRVFLVQILHDAPSEAQVAYYGDVCAPGIPRITTGTSVRAMPFSSLSKQILDSLTNGIPIATSAAELSIAAPEVAAILQSLDIQAINMLPVRQGSQLWGGLGCHICTAPRVWEPQELRLIQTVAELIGAALQRWADEDELRRREELLTTLFDLLPVGLVVVDQTGQPMRVNRAMTHIAERCHATVGTSHCESKICSQDGRPFEPRAWPILRAMAGEVVRDSEIELLSPQGEQIWLSASAAPLPATEMGATMVVLDITDRRQAEHERLTLERRLLEAQRMESLGVLAGGAAHDFNNILTAIMGHAELACLDAPSGSELAASLDAILLGARRAADLTTQMLAYAGRGRTVIEYVNLEEVVLELSELIRATLPRGVKISYNLAPGLPAILADGTQVRQVLLNLLTNAAESVAVSGKPGTVSVHTGSCTLSDQDLTRAIVSSARPGQFGFLEVRDTGHGIAQADLRRIFEPFFSTKFTGRGLGLAAVQGIVRAQHGSLIVESSPGEGACFRVCFPCAPPNEQVIAKAQLEALPAVR